MKLRFLAVLTLAMGVLLVSSGSASGAFPTQDSVKGFSPFFNSPFTMSVDAHSGPRGQTPGGGVTVNFDTFWNGPVTCLAVKGNVATFSWHSTEGDLKAEVVDNAGTGAPDTMKGPLLATSGCDPIGGEAGPIAFGDYTVVDAPPLPTVTTTVPADGAIGVPRDRPIVAAFSEPMNTAETQAAFSLRRTSTGALVAGTFSWYYGVGLVFTPSAPLTPGAAYTASISTAAVSTEGWHLQSPKFWQFTASSDTTAPTVSNVSPANGASGVSRDSPVVAAFSESMDKSETQAAFSLKRTSTGTAVSGRFDWYGTAGLVFTPSSSLVPGAQYSATVSTNARDTSGNRLAAAKVWNFTANSDVTAPTVTTVYPADGATGVASNAQVVAAFSEEMAKAATQGAFSLKRTSDGATVTGRLDWYGPRALVFTPSNLLAAGAQYTATVSTAAKDLANNNLAAPKVWKFSVYP